MAGLWTALWLFSLAALPPVPTFAHDAAVVTGNLGCKSASSTQISLSFTTVARTDAYQVQICRSDSDLHPVIVQTLEHNAGSTANPVDLDISFKDLHPNTTYFFQLRTHNASAPSIVQGWLPAGSTVVSCRTSVIRENVPHTIRYHGSKPAVDHIAVSWSWPTRNDRTCVNKAMLYRKVQATRSTKSKNQREPWNVHKLDNSHDFLPSESTTKSSLAHVPTNTSRVATVVYGLESASTYEIVIRGCNGELSDPEIFQTSAVNISYSEMYRVSEYLYEVDFLANHNSADLDGQTAFLTSTNDNDFFKLALSPVTRYCVEHIAPTATPLGTFAPYVSCNGPEAEPRNDPKDPMCICDVYADRMIALQTAKEMNTSRYFLPQHCIVMLAKN